MVLPSSQNKGKKIIAEHQLEEEIQDVGGKGMLRLLIKWKVPGRVADLRQMMM